MTILITGGAGFIGTRLVAALAGTERIVVVDNLHPQVHGADAAAPVLPAGAEFVRGDVADPVMWDAVFQQVQPSTVVHLAAETGTGQSLLEASRHTEVNVHGTAVMLDALARAGVVPAAFVLASSRAVYGEGVWLDPRTDEAFYALPRSIRQLEAREWDPRGTEGQMGVPTAHDASLVEPRPTNVYAATKLAQENILAAWVRAMDSSLTVLRLQNVYGAGQALNNPYTGVLTFFARRTLGGQPIEVYEEGGITRDFVHVSDVVRALTSSIHTARDRGQSRVLDIGSGRAGTLLDFARSMQAANGTESLEITSAYRRGDVRAAYASNARAERHIGYLPQVSFETGVAELLDWAKKELGVG